MPMPLLEVRGVSKAFGATRALADVSASFFGGEVHALLGENGAGKSTLVKVLSGNILPDAGSILVEGTERKFSTPRQAMENGVQVVHQELSVLNNLRVFENITLGRTPFKKYRRGIVDRPRARLIARQCLEKLGYSLDIEKYVGDLPQAEKQIVEIARSLAAKASILLLDEPTSSLPPDERAKLYDLIRSIKKQGVAIVLITHNLEEALEHADCITILRDGRLVSSSSSKISVVEVVEHMTGRKPGQTFPSRPRIAQSVARLKVSDLIVEGTNEQISFEVQPGEIVGLAGLVGSGRSEMLGSIFGTKDISFGRLEIDGRCYVPSSPATAIQLGIAYITADRQADGLFHPLSVLQNLVIARQYRRPLDTAILSAGIIKRNPTRVLARQLLEKVKIKAESLDSPVVSLSGGNQQKVIIGRWLANDPRLVLADEPTRGVSIGSKMDIYALMRKMSKQGVSFLVSSSEFEELIGLCDRILIVARNRIVDTAAAKVLTPEALLERVLTLSQSAKSSGIESGT